MKNKKFLLDLSLCLGGIATVVPLTLTSCSMNKQPISIERPSDSADEPNDSTDKPSDSTDEESNPTDKPNNPTDKPSDSTSESSKYKEFIGRNVKWTDEKNKVHEGILVKVESNKIWIDTLVPLIDVIEDFSYVQEFALPLKTYNFTADAYQSISKENALALLRDIKSELPQDYISQTESAFNQYLGKETNQKAKSIANEMLTIFKNKMTTFTAEKLEEAITYLSSNNSLNKLDNLISYYVDTFVWARENFFSKYMELIKSATNPAETEALSLGVAEISAFLYVFTETISTVKVF